MFLVFRFLIKEAGSSVTYHFKVTRYHPGQYYSNAVPGAAVQHHLGAC